MKATFAITGSLILVASFALAADSPKHSYKPDAGYVPDAKTAIKIAVAVWEPIYGEKQIAKQSRITQRSPMVFGQWKGRSTVQVSAVWRSRKSPKTMPEF